MKFLRQHQLLLPESSAWSAPQRSYDPETKKVEDYPTSKKRADVTGPHWKNVGRRFKSVLGEWCGWIKGKQRIIFVFENVRFGSTMTPHADQSKFSREIPRSLEYKPNKKYLPGTEVFSPKVKKWFKFVPKEKPDEDSRVLPKTTPFKANEEWEEIEKFNYSEPEYVEDENGEEQIIVRKIIAIPGDTLRNEDGEGISGAKLFTGRLETWAFNGFGKEPLSEEYLTTDRQGRRITTEEFPNAYPANTKENKEKAEKIIRRFYPRQELPERVGKISRKPTSVGMRELVWFIKEMKKGAEKEKAESTARAKRKEYSDTRRKKATDTSDDDWDEFDDFDNDSKKSLRDDANQIYKNVGMYLYNKIFKNVKAIDEPPSVPEDKMQIDVSKDNYKFRKQISSYVRAVESEEDKFFPGTKPKSEEKKAQYKLTRKIIDLVKDVFNDESDAPEIAKGALLSRTWGGDEVIAMAFGLPVLFAKSESRQGQGSRKKGNVIKRFKEWLQAGKDKENNVYKLFNYMKNERPEIADIIENQLLQSMDGKNETVQHAIAEKIRFADRTMPRAATIITQHAVKDEETGRKAKSVTYKDLKRGYLNLMDGTKKQRDQYKRRIAEIFKLSLIDAKALKSLIESFVAEKLSDDPEVDPKHILEELGILRGNIPHTAGKLYKKIKETSTKEEWNEFDLMLDVLKAQINDQIDFNSYSITNQLTEIWKELEKEQ
jgi:hypothetical protein